MGARRPPDHQQSELVALKGSMMDTENPLGGDPQVELRFCPRCRADVEDAGGYCLLGHPFPEDRVDAIADLRAEVDDALSTVRSVVDAGEALKAAEAELSGDLEDEAQVAAAMKATSLKVYEELANDDEPISRNDPIVAFSPSPRAEWGPEKGRRSRKERSA